MPRDANWLIGVTLLAEVCGALGTGSGRGRSTRCSSRTPGRNVVGPRRDVQRRRRAAAGDAGGRDAAAGSSPRATHNALAMHERMGARPWVARTQLAYAEMLLARRRAGDKARARDLLADAVLTADALGMRCFAQRARDLVPAGTAGPGGAVAARR